MNRVRLQASNQAVGHDVGQPGNHQGGVYRNLDLVLKHNSLIAGGQP